MIYVAYDPVTGIVEETAYADPAWAPTGKSTLPVAEDQWNAAAGKVKKIVDGRFGWYDPPPVPRTTCTKYELVTALREKFPELLEQLRQAYATDLELQFYWNTVNDLDLGNPDFQSAVKKLGIADSQLNAIFAAIGGEERGQK